MYSKYRIHVHGHTFYSIFEITLKTHFKSGILNINEKKHKYMNIKYKHIYTRILECTAGDAFCIG